MVPLKSADGRPLRSIHRLDEPAELSLGMVASQQSQLPISPGPPPYAAVIVATAISGKVGGAFLGGAIMRFGLRDSLALASC